MDWHDEESVRGPDHTLRKSPRGSAGLHMVRLLSGDVEATR
jgi:hypothetical protein